MADYPIYDLSLLITLDARDHRTNDLIGPAEAMQKMQRMFSENGINPLQVMLRIEPHQVVITDVASGTDVERIHLGMVHNPASITSNHVAGFDNIIMFTVVDDRYTAELHIFQCLERPAPDLVADLKAAKEGRLFSANRKQPSSVSGSKKSATDKSNEYEQQSQRLATATISYRPGPAPGKMLRQALSANDHIRIDSDATVGKIETLNHCFDDIEKFVGRLQQAANAFRELTRRRENRHGVGLGDGMLGMRARPPPASDYVDILQKFKLSFNLLAKLKSHIRNPNAPELIHYLFSPLELILDTILDPSQGKPVLASKVYSPLLNADTLLLLSNCMTSLETDLLASLGQAWNVAREDWPVAVAPYYPQFFDDWTPNPAWLEDVGVGTAAVAVGLAYKHQRNKSDDGPGLSAQPQNSYNGLGNGYSPSKPVSRSQSTATPSSVQMRQGGAASRGSHLTRASAGYMIARELNSSEMDQDDYHRKLQARGAQICQAKGDRAARADRELAVKEGEILEVLDSSTNWWLTCNDSGQTGYVPYTILKKLDTSTPTSSGASTPRSTGAATPIAAITTSSKYNSDNANGYGHINATAESILADTNAKFTKVSPFTGNSLSDGQKYIDEIKPAKLLPQHRTVTDDVNDEFKRNLDLHIKPRPSRKIESMDGMCFIDKTSTSEEIREWLIMKGFSENVQHTMREYKGIHLFALTKSNCESLFGKKEGSKLYSQILVQRNRSGFRTPRVAELEAILRIQKAKAEKADQTNF